MARTLGSAAPEGWFCILQSSKWMLFQPISVHQSKQIRTLGDPNRGQRNEAREQGSRIHFHPKIGGVADTLVSDPASVLEITH